MSKRSKNMGNLIRRGRARSVSPPLADGHPTAPIRLEANATTVSFLLLITDGIGRLTRAIFNGSFSLRLIQLIQFIGNPARFLSAMGGFPPGWHLLCILQSLCQALFLPRISAPRLK